MRILLINDQLICGGTEVQVLREKQLLEQHGHQVLLLTFDSAFPTGDARFTRDSGFVNIAVRKNLLSSLLRRLRLLRARPRLQARIRSEIRAFRPDVAHAHNIYVDPVTVYRALRGQVVVQTLRDYRAVCPLGTCVLPDGAVCAGCAHSDCWRTCGPALGKRRRLRKWRRARSARLASADLFLAPSEKLVELCAANGISAQCVNNPFDFERFPAPDRRPDFVTRKYVYFGSIAEHKGIFQLLEAFADFQQGRDVELLIAGSIDEPIRQRFMAQIAGRDWANYVGFLDHTSMLEVIGSAYAIVVPSVWMENYPNTVLEGMALGVLVTGSNRGGIPEMLADAARFTFDVYDRNSIVATLVRADELTESEYRQAVAANRELVVQRNAMDRFYGQLMRCFDEAQAAT